MSADCATDPICFVCEEDLDCQRCNADGCHFPERVCDLPGEDGTRACVSPAVTCHEDDDCRCTPEGDCRWPEAYCEPRENQSFGACVYPSP